MESHIHALAAPAMPSSPASVGKLVCRIRGEFSEMPGLRLTLDQGMRLWSLDRSTCVRVLNALIATGFLSKDQNERYTRTHAGY